MRSRLDNDSNSDSDSNHHNDNNDGLPYSLVYISFKVVRRLFKTIAKVKAH